jgi:hypothetical protein
LRRSKPLALSRQSIRLRNQKFKIPRPERSWEAGTQEDLASRMLTTQQCCTADQRTRSVICSCQRPTRNSVRSPHHEQHHRTPRASRSPIKSSGAGYYTAAQQREDTRDAWGWWWLGPWAQLGAMQPATTRTRTKPALHLWCSPSCQTKAAPLDPETLLGSLDTPTPGGTRV